MADSTDMTATGTADPRDPRAAEPEHPQAPAAGPEPVPAHPFQTPAVPSGLDDPRTIHPPDGQGRPDDVLPAGTPTLGGSETPPTLPPGRPNPPQAGRDAATPDDTRHADDAPATQTI